MSSMFCFAVCRVAIEAQDPVCKNGGYLRADNHTDQPTSCADCICPPGWTGADCSRKNGVWTEGAPERRDVEYDTFKPSGLV